MNPPTINEDFLSSQHNTKQVRDSPAKMRHNSRISASFDNDRRVLSASFRVSAFYSSIAPMWSLDYETSFVSTASNHSSTPYIQSLSTKCPLFSAGFFSKLRYGEFTLPLQVWIILNAVAGLYDSYRE